MKYFLNKIGTYVQELKFALYHGKGIINKIKLLTTTLVFHLSSKQILNLSSNAINYQLEINGNILNVFLRTNSGDLFVFYEIFLEKCYYVPSSWLPEAKTIIDLGANIGMTTLFYKNSNYQDAHYICVEAAAQNLKILKANTNYSSSIHIVEGAINSESGWVYFDDQQAAWGGSITENQDAVRVRSYTMVELVENYNIETIDLLKIDIEGGEATLLSENNEWLKKVRFIIIELHHPYLSIEQLKNLLIPYGFVVISCAPKYKVKMVCAFVPERVNIDLNDPAIKTYIV